MSECSFVEKPFLDQYPFVGWSYRWRASTSSFAESSRDTRDAALVWNDEVD